MEMNSRTALIVAVVVGLIAGLLLGMLLFWQLFPVKWTNGQAYDLAPEARAEYVALVADSYRLNRDPIQAAELLEYWTPEEKQQAFADAEASAEARGLVEQSQSVRDLSMVLGVSATPPEPPEAPPTIVDRFRVPCMVFLVVLLALVLGYLGFRALMNRRSTQATPDPEPRFVPAEPGVQATDEWDEDDTSPLESFVTTYRLGEDTYDESFSIETEMGEFLGECGVGISEIIGDSDPDKVTAFEVWLFDKSDIRTVTKVLMSEHAFRDEALRAKLMSKGEAVLAQPNTPFSLETSALQVRVNVTELEYGDEGAALDSFFERLTVELLAMVSPAESEANSL
ncbi:hypothetical protein ACFLT5_02360 [Chloroflexota bacterium]